MINTRSAFGVCARGSGTFSHNVFLIFRGTTTGNYGADFFTDARAGLTVGITQSLVHAGFNQTFNSLRDEVASFMNRQSDVRTVHCIGHSLGGAIANLMADWISDAYGKAVKLYTFGAPRVGIGQTGFSKKLTTKLKPENIHRVYHGTDPVPMVPLFPFEHAPTWGHAYYLPFGGVVINFKAHKMTSYIQSVKGRDWERLYQPKPGFSHDIRAWLRSDTVEDAQSARFWEKLNLAAAYVVQVILSVVAVPFVSGLTVADYLAIILMKGITLTAEISSWVLLLIRKMMRMLKMSVIETAEALTYQLIRLVLNRVIEKINSAVRQAIKRIE